MPKKIADKVEKKVQSTACRFKDNMFCAAKKKKSFRKLVAIHY